MSAISPSESQDRTIVSVEDLEFFESEDGTIVTAEHFECYEEYCELMELMRERDERLAMLIAKAKEDTQALILWRDKLIQSSEEKVAKTYQIIEASKVEQEKDLKKMKERSELEEMQNQERVQRAEDREEELKKAILATQAVMQEKEKLLAAETLRSQRLKQGIL